MQCKLNTKTNHAKLLNTEGAVLASINIFAAPCIECVDRLTVSADFLYLVPLMVAMGRPFETLMNQTHSLNLFNK